MSNRALLSLRAKKKLVLDTYNEVTQNSVMNKESLQLIWKTMKRVIDSEKDIPELSLLYALQSDYYFNRGEFNKSEDAIFKAYKLDCESMEVLRSLITFHLPLNDRNRKNPFRDIKKAKQYVIYLEKLYPKNVKALFIAVNYYYNRLGFYDESLQKLKASYSKISQEKNASNANAKNRICELITQTLVERYRVTPNESHTKIIAYLIEIIQWKHNNFNTEQLKTAIEEIWERIEFLLQEINESLDDNNIGLQFNQFWNLIDSIPVCIPFSYQILKLIFELFAYEFEKYKYGIKYFTRLITEYQTYNDNMFTIHARFECFDALYLYRAKLYQLINEINDIGPDIESVNRILCDNSIHNNNNQKIVLVNYNNLSSYDLKKISNAPFIETSTQIIQRRASSIASSDRSNIAISPMSPKYRNIHLNASKNQQNNALMNNNHNNNNNERATMEKNENEKKSESDNEEMEKENTMNNSNDRKKKFFQTRNKIFEEQNQIRKEMLDHSHNKNSNQWTENTIKQKFEHQLNELKNKLKFKDEEIKKLQSKNQTLNQSLKIMKDCRIKDRRMKSRVSVSPKKKIISMVPKNTLVLNPNVENSNNNQPIEGIPDEIQNKRMENKPKKATTRRYCGFANVCELIFALVVFVGLLMLFMEWYNHQNIDKSFEKEL